MISVYCAHYKTYRVERVGIFVQVSLVDVVSVLRCEPDKLVAVPLVERETLRVFAVSYNFITWQRIAACTSCEVWLRLFRKVGLDGLLGLVSDHMADPVSLDLHFFS